MTLLWLILHHIFSGRGTTPMPKATESAEPESKPCGSGESTRTLEPRLATEPADERRCERQGKDMDVVVITDTTPRAELEEALTHLAATASRLPRHYVERKAALHAKIDVLLTEWQASA